MTKRHVTLIAGPTASGKSDFALKLAKQSSGIIINADSMQVYDVLRVITARPSGHDMAEAPHFLYGHVDPAVNYSTGKWLRDVTALLQQLPSAPLIFVGGTGLYFRALTQGLAQIPEIPIDVRENLRHRLDESGSAELHQYLQTIDPQSASRIETNDSQRIIRALEVFDATAKTLSWWQQQKSEPLLDEEEIQKYLLLPERESVYQRINQRFDHMVEQGALDEVRLLAKMELDPLLPAMKAIGVPEFLAVLSGQQPLESAIETAKMQTRRYAKRQMTWFRHQIDSHWNRV
ncbi:tRNA (adenosine(37)-N6)-dimethylallyltransferase MiaA [Bartonella sp. LJL80]